jgi:hypothetical protein
VREEFVDALCDEQRAEAPHDDATRPRPLEESEDADECAGPSSPGVVSVKLLVGESSSRCCSRHSYRGGERVVENHPAWRVIERRCLRDGRARIVVESASRDTPDTVTRVRTGNDSTVTYTNILARSSNPGQLRRPDRRPCRRPLRTTPEGRSGSTRSVGVRDDSGPLLL